MLTHIVKFLNKVKILPNDKIPEKLILGRWCTSNREYNDRKIDMANIDHCGTCFYNYKKDTTKTPEVSKDSPPPTPK